MTAVVATQTGQPKPWPSGTTVNARERDKYLMRSQFRLGPPQQQQQQQQQVAATTTPPNPWAAAAAPRPTWPPPVRPPGTVPPVAYNPYRPPAPTWPPQAAAPLANPWAAAAQQPAWRPPGQPAAPTWPPPATQQAPGFNMTPYGAYSTPQQMPWQQQQQQPPQMWPPPAGTYPGAYPGYPQPPNMWGQPAAAAAPQWNVASSVLSRRHMPTRAATGGTQLAAPAAGATADPYNPASGVQPFQPLPSTTTSVAAPVAVPEPAPAATLAAGETNLTVSGAPAGSQSRVRAASRVPSLASLAGQPFPMVQQQAEQDIKGQLQDLQSLQQSLESQQQHVQSLFEVQQHELTQQMLQLPPMIRFQRFIRTLKAAPSRLDVPYGKLQETFQLWRAANPDFARILVADQLVQLLHLQGVVTVTVEDHDNIVFQLNQDLVFQAFKELPPSSNLGKTAMAMLQAAAIDALEVLASYILENDIFRSMMIRVGTQPLHVVHQFTNRVSGKFVEDVVFQETRTADFATMVRAAAGMDSLAAPSRFMPYRPWMLNVLPAGGTTADPNSTPVPLPPGTPESWKDLMDKNTFGHAPTSEMVSRYPGTAKPLPLDPIHMRELTTDVQFYEVFPFLSRLQPPVVVVQAAFKRRMDFAEDSATDIGRAEDSSMPFLLRDSRHAINVARQQQGLPPLSAAVLGPTRPGQPPVQQQPQQQIEITWPDPRVPTIFGLARDEDALSLLLPIENRAVARTAAAIGGKYALAPPPALHSLSALRTSLTGSPADVSVGMCVHVVDRQTRVQLFLPWRWVQRLPFFAQNMTAQDNGTITPVELNIPGTSVRAMECILLYLELNDLTGDQPQKGDLMPLPFAVHPVVFRNSILTVDQVITRPSDKLFINLVDSVYQHPYNMAHKNARIWLEIGTTAHMCKLWRLAALSAIVLAEHIRRLRTRDNILSELASSSAAAVAGKVKFE